MISALVTSASAGRALQKVARLGEAREATRRDMRHRHEAGAAQPDAGGDDVVMGDARRMVDEHRRSRREQLAEPVSRRASRGEISIEHAPISCAARRRGPGHAAARVRRCHAGAGHQPESRLREIT